MLFKLIVATILTGLISGFFITFYELLIIFLSYVIFMGDPFKTIPTLPIWYIYFVPISAMLLVNYIVSKDKGVREYGVSEIAESVIANRMTLSIKTLFLKVIASALSLASGFSVGTEGPSAGIGAMIAYQIHKLFRLPIMLVKMMISVGASSGIAAIFGTPITGIAFAIENIAYQFFKQYIGYVILSSVIAFAVASQYLEIITFKYSIGRAIKYDYITPILIFIPFITLFIYFYLFMKKNLLHFIDMKMFKTFPAYRNYFFALLGGSVIGTILLIEPQAAFSGKEMVMDLMNSDKHISLVLILTIITLRIIGTTTSIYANAVGGVFLPLMSIGALVGYGFAEAIILIYPFPVEPFYFAAIGASVFMGVLMKLPLTAVVLSLETTFDYNVVIATGICVVLVTYLSNLYFDIRKNYSTRADKVQRVE